jgi:hypothetical protein
LPFGIFGVICIFSQFSPVLVYYITKNLAALALTGDAGNGSGSDEVRRNFPLRLFLLPLPQHQVPGNGSVIGRRREPESELTVEQSDCWIVYARA